jgi:hypothetical protein
MQRALVAVFLVGCSGAPVHVDAGSDDAGIDVGRDGGGRFDAGLDGGRLVPDAGRDADMPSIDDAGRDAGRVDAGPPPVCDLVTQEGCAINQACRRGDSIPSTVPPSGPPECELVRTPSPNEWCWPSGVTGCRDAEGHDLCGRGLFCQSFGCCVRFCDPVGTPCPTNISGTAQHCELGGPGIDGFCSATTF